MGRWEDGRVVQIRAINFKLNAWAVRLACLDVAEHFNDLSLTVAFLIAVASQVGFYPQSDSCIFTSTHDSILYSSQTDTQIRFQPLLVTFIFKFRIQRRILDGAHFQGMDACLFALQYLRSAPGAFGSSEVYDMSECTWICDWLTISAAVLALSISHKTFTVHHHF